MTSENSDDVKVVIRKYAADPTTFINKRQYRSTLSITGQPGFFISGEKLEFSERIGFVAGVTLPIGFEYSFKLKHGKDNSASLAIFLQILDLGAVLNFRMADSTSTLVDKITFEQVLSPGGSINYGFKNSPLTLGIGYQYTPQLREVSDKGNAIYDNGHRIFARVAWDIPLINIAKSKKK